MTLLQCAFRLDLTDRDSLVRQMDFLRRLAHVVRVRRLRVPDDLEALPAVVRLVREDVDAGLWSRAA